MLAHRTPPVGCPAVNRKQNDTRALLLRVGKEASSLSYHAGCGVVDVIKMMER
jgi:hypothetical protein